MAGQVVNETREFYERTFERALAAISGSGRRRWTEMLSHEWRLNEARPEHVARHIRQDLSEAAEALAMYLDDSFEPS